MIEKFLAFIERITAALEKIASVQTTPAAVPQQPAAAPAAVTRSPKPRKPAADAPPPSSDVDLDDTGADDTSFLDDPAPPADTKKVTREEVRAKLVEYGTKAGDSLKARQLLKELTRKDVLADVPEETYGQVAAGIDKAIAALPKK